VADTRDLHLPFEVEVFYIHHWVLVSSPYIIMWLKHVPLYNPRVMYAWLVLLAYHFHVLLPASVMFGANISYMMSPPRGKVLHAFGPWYRFAVSFVCLGLTAFARHVIVGGVSTAVSKLHQSVLPSAMQSKAWIASKFTGHIAVAQLSTGFHTSRPSSHGD